MIDEIIKTVQEKAKKTEMDFYGDLNGILSSWEVKSNQLIEKQTTKHEEILCRLKKSTELGCEQYRKMFQDNYNKFEKHYTQIMNTINDQREKYNTINDKLEGLVDLLIKEQNIIRETFSSVLESAVTTSAEQTSSITSLNEKLLDIQNGLQMSINNQSSDMTSKLAEHAERLESKYNESKKVNYMLIIINAILFIITAAIVILK